jgi:hypothetical protein
MIVYNSFTGTPRTPQPNPMVSGEYLYRSDDILEEPPSFDAEKQTCKYIDDKWIVEDIPEEEENPETYVENPKE